MVRDDVAALSDQRIGRIGFLARVIPSVGPDHINLHVGIDGLSTQRVCIDALEHFGNRHSGDVTQMAVLAHRSGKLACEITSLIKASVVVTEIVGRLITRACSNFTSGNSLATLSAGFMNSKLVAKMILLPCEARSRITRSASAIVVTFSTNCVLILSPNCFWIS